MVTTATTAENSYWEKKNWETFVWFIKTKNWSKKIDKHFFKPQCVISSSHEIIFGYENLHSISLMQNQHFKRYWVKNNSACIFEPSSCMPQKIEHLPYNYERYEKPLPPFHHFIINQAGCYSYHFHWKLDQKNSHAIIPSVSFCG